MKIYTLNCLKSQIINFPSSPPETINGSFLFQLITLISLSWALNIVNMFALFGANRVSHNFSLKKIVSTYILNP